MLQMQALLGVILRKTHETLKLAYRYTNKVDQLKLINTKRINTIAFLAYREASLE